MEHRRQGLFIEEPEAGLAVNGRKRGQCNASYDYVVRRPDDNKSLRVEVKSSRLCWSSTQNH
eukprot:5943299-Amphidinium_carterae.1